MDVEVSRRDKRVLVLGGGGREHALAWSLSRSQQVERVFVAPGNGGTSWPKGSGNHLQPGAPCERIKELSPMDFQAVLEFVREKDIYLTVVGDAEPLSAGIVEAFRPTPYRIFGPDPDAAMIESSKSFAKLLMAQCGIPTADFKLFDDYSSARAYLDTIQRSIVVKADGLADGKGTYVCHSIEAAQSALHTIMQKRRFGDAGKRVVVEEYLVGEEVSFFAFVSGRSVKPILAVRDYKRIYEGNKGPNTGGVGSIAPIELSQSQIDEVVDTILQPLAHELYLRGTPYHGVVFAGLIVTEDGVKVLEFNCRFGDPETQAMLPLLVSDFFEAIDKCVDGHLDDIDLVWADQKCATVITCTHGYPEQYNPGIAIEINPHEESKTSIIFHAGTDWIDGQLITSAGRIFAVSSLAPSMIEAANRSYDMIKHISFEGKYWRSDIGIS